MEVPLTVAEVSLYGRATMQPLDHLSTEVTTIAKRNLSPGDVLEGIGGRTHRAGCMSYVDACAADALPLGLARGCKVKVSVAKGTLIARSMVAPVDNLLHQLRAEQDRFSEVLV
jgi:predicted homoserine dehydrogenase-like protein